MSDKSLENGETERNERQVIDYTLSVRGVFGRNRKEKREHYRIRRVNLGASVNLAEVIAEALEKCREIKLKSGARITIDSNPVTLKDYAQSSGSLAGRVITMESFLLYSGARVYAADWNGETVTNPESA